MASLPPAALDGRAMHWWLARQFSTWRRQFSRGSACPSATTWKGVYCWKALKSRLRSLVWQAGNQRKRLPRLALPRGLLPLLHWRRGGGGGGAGAPFARAVLNSTTVAEVPGSPDNPTAAALLQRETDWNLAQSYLDAARCEEALPEIGRAS